MLSNDEFLTSYSFYPLVHQVCNWQGTREGDLNHAHRLSPRTRVSGTRWGNPSAVDGKSISGQCVSASVCSKWRGRFYPRFYQRLISARMAWIAKHLPRRSVRERSRHFIPHQEKWHLPHDSAFFRVIPHNSNFAMKRAIQKSLRQVKSVKASLQLTRLLGDLEPNMPGLSPIGFLCRPLT